jgi:hypothetical protein
VREETTTSPVEILPWKREEVDLFCPLAMKQREFPLWIKNKEYIECSSPSNTFGVCATFINLFYGMNF